MTLSKNRARFIDLAEKRVTRLIRDIRLVGNLSNKSNYSYTDKELKKILYTIKREVRNLELRFQNKNKKSDITFKL